MNKYQILSIVLIILSIFFTLNLKFKVQRFINISAPDTIESILMSNRDSSKKPAYGIEMLSAKMFYIASFVIGIIAAIPLLISIYLFNIWFTSYNLANDSLNWTPVKAKVTSKSRSASTSSRDRQSSLTYYSDNVQYEYIHDGKLYKGHTLSYDNGWATSNPNNSSNLLRSVPKTGEETTVYFDEKTGRSVMFPGRKYTYYRTLLITTPVFLAGVIIAYFSFACAIVALAIKH